MMLGEPGRTAYDLSFDFFGIPVRIHPGFFVIGALFGSSWIAAPELNAGIRVLLGVALIFIAVLVHELGHVLAYRYFGQAGRIVLYWLGGVAIADGGSGNLPWARTSTQRFSGNRQIIISLAGPVAGILLIVPLIAIVYAAGGTVAWGTFLGFIPAPIPFLEGTALGNVPGATGFIDAAILISLLLNLINLVPIYPLDGGQVARELLLKFDPWNGMQNSLILSVAAGVLMAVWGLSGGDRFVAIFFGYMAWENYQRLQQTGGTNRPW